MGLGWFLSQKKLVSSNADATLITLVWDIALPSAMLLGVLQLGAISALNLKFVLTYFLSMAAPFFIAFILCRIFERRGRPIEHFMVGVSAAISNSALVAFPILLLIFGHQAAIPMVGILMLSMLVIVPLRIIVLEYGQHVDKEQTSFLKVFFVAVKRTVIQMFFIMTCLGIVLDIFSVNLPKALETFFHYLALMMIPCALIAIGMGLKKIETLRFGWKVWVAVGINLLVKPAIAIGIALLFHLSALYAIALLVVSSAPAASTTYILAKRYQVYEKEIASAIFLTTVLFIFTMPLFLWWASHYWVFA